MLKYLVIFLIYGAIFGQNNQDDTQRNQSESVVEYSESLLDSLRKIKGYQYDLSQDEIEQPESSLFSDITLDDLMISAGFILLFYFIFQFASDSNLNWVFAGKDVDVAVKKELNLENSQENQMEKHIQDAMNRKDYKLVIHYYYLHILNILISKKWIRFEKEKTNRDYYYEISDQKVKSYFQDFTRDFEYVYYGEFEVSESAIIAITENYRTFLQSMQT